MLKEIIVNQSKWFNIADNAHELTANGRTFYAIPKAVTIFQSNERIRKIVENWRRASSYLNGDSELFVKGITPEGYLCYGTIKATEGGPDTFNFWIREDNPILIYFSEAKNVKWGGKSLLNRLYQPLQATFLRSEVVAA